MGLKDNRLHPKTRSKTSKDLVGHVKRSLFGRSEIENEQEMKSNYAGASCQNSYPVSESRIEAGEADTSSVSVVGVSICICCLLITVLSFLLPHWFTSHLGGSIEKTDGQLYIHFKNNLRIYVIGMLTATVFSSVCALACCCTSWTITYFDSVDPGKNPPTPLSPTKYRQQSGHTFHSSYVTSLLNSLAVALYVLWWRRSDYLVL